MYLIMQRSNYMLSKQFRIPKSISQLRKRMMIFFMYSVTSILLKVFTNSFCPPFISNSILADFLEARVAVSYDVFFCVFSQNKRESNINKRRNRKRKRYLMKKRSIIKVYLLCILTQNLLESALSYEQIHENDYYDIDEKSFSIMAC